MEKRKAQKTLWIHKRTPEEIKKLCTVTRWYKNVVMCLGTVMVNGNHVECRKCPECIVKRQNEWIFRIKQELADSSSGWFITLTYNETNVPKVYVNKHDGEIVISRKPINNENWLFQCRTLLQTDLQKFFKRLRKLQDKRNKLEKNEWMPIKYYAVGEYGEKTKRPHFHAIIFNANFTEIKKAWTEVNNSDIEGETGNVHTGQVSHASIRYVVKYMSKRQQDAPPGAEKPKCSMSKGLGKGYIKKYRDHHRINQRMYCVEQDGYKIAMPKYYKEKIFDDHKILRHIQIKKDQLQATPIGDSEFIKFVNEEINKVRFNKALRTRARLDKHQQSNKM